MSGVSNSGEWHGEDWTLEVEPDCFDVEEGLIVSVVVTQADETLLAQLSPAEARGVAAVLAACADHVERVR